MKKITTSFVRENYDLKDERKLIPEKRVVKTFDMSIIDFKPLSKKDFLEMIAEQIPDGDDYKVEIIPYGYDGGFEISCFEESDRYETEIETIERIKKELREIRKREREIEKAKKVLGLEE